MPFTEDPADATLAADREGLAPPARYADWKAPAEDGRALIWPAAVELLRGAAENNRLLCQAREVLIQNVPLPEIRHRFRHLLGHAGDDVPLVATGHQTELHHPGVWVKNALIDAAAARLGGRAYHFAVDTDAPKHLALRWPAYGGTPGGAEPLTDDPAAGTARWSGLLVGPTPGHLDRLSADFKQSAATWGFLPLVPAFLASLRDSRAAASALPAATAKALHALDRELGLDYEVRLVSPLCASAPYLLFAHHLLARADAFATAYNAALADYRIEHKIRTPGRPMPDLDVTPDQCEVPFWLDDLATGDRARATVKRIGGSWVLAASKGNEAFRFDSAVDGWSAASSLGDWLSAHRLRLAPRALTLTAVLRLLAADQFVHGIGGGRYDQVLDRLIATHFGVAPPRFAVTTATLFFPPAVAQPRACVPCVKLDALRARHAALGPAKRPLVEAIAAAPRRSAERSRLFQKLHAELRTARLREAGQSDWDQLLRDTIEQERQERALFDRELFYAIQPADRLKEMIERYRAALA